MALVVDASVTASWLLPIQLDHMTESVSVMELARKHESIPYDAAAYLELRETLPLATLDRHWRRGCWLRASR